MSDAFADQVKKDEQPSGPSPDIKRSIVLSVTLHPDGQMEFSMPAKNKILAYGMLECARAQLDKIYLMQDAKASQVPNGIDGLLRRMNGR